MSNGKQSAQVIPLGAPTQPRDTQQGDRGDVFQGVLPGLPDKPDNLEPDEFRFWDEFGLALSDAGILTQLDLSAYHRYVVSYCQWRKWNDLCQEDFGLGSIQTYATGAKSLSVEAVLRKGCADELRKLEHQFGLTPRARQAIKIENPDQFDLDL